MITHEPVSRPINLRDGVRGTGGRPLAPRDVERPRPPLSDEAAMMLASLPRGETSAGFVTRIAAKPSRAGAQALAYLGWSFREAARTKDSDDVDAEVSLAEYLEMVSKTVDAQIDGQESSKFLAIAEETISRAYAIGVAAGRQQLEQKLAADATRPVLERHVEFLSDARGQIVGKVEREYNGPVPKAGRGGEST